MTRDVGSVITYIVQIGWNQESKTRDRDRVNKFRDQGSGIKILKLYFGIRDAHAMFELQNLVKTSETIMVFVF